MLQRDNKVFKKEILRDYKCVGPLACPALDNELIYFTKDGFNHLIRKGRKLREQYEQHERLALFQYVPSIIESSRMYILHRVHSKNSINKSSAQFWSLENKIQGEVVVVIIRQINSGTKHFFSVFYKKHTNPVGGL